MPRLLYFALFCAEPKHPDAPAVTYHELKPCFYNAASRRIGRFCVAVSGTRQERPQLNTRVFEDTTIHLQSLSISRSLLVEIFHIQLRLP